MESHSVFATGVGGSLHGQLWCDTQDIVGTILLVHGLGDQSSHFADMASQLNHCHWAVAAMDLPGHGKSQSLGKNRFRDWLMHIGAFTKDVRTRVRSDRMVLLGHSMGGNLALNYVLRQHNLIPKTPKIDGLVLCAPMLLPPKPMARPIIFAAWATGYLMPFLRFSHNVAAESLTSDTEYLETVRRDSSSSSKISMQFATQLIAQGRWALDRARELDTPTLVMLGEEDELIDRAACEHLTIRAGDLAELAIFQDTRHAIFHDKTRSQVIARLSDWLTSKMVPD